MVTSNKLSDRKVVKMAEQNNSVVVPQRTLIGEVNEHITCPLCRGYYIDATTIVECLHSFCRSCIINHLQVKSYCPVCEMMINSAKPNIKLDKALQDIVYKLVPGLFQKEMERRQTFYASRPGPAATATPEQRGEDTERIIFSPEDVISFSLEFSDATDADSISSKSSDSNDPQPNQGTTRRFLQCPAVVNVNHLKKFLSMKFDIDSTQFAIDILYKRVQLPDYYTLMDIAYIYNWKRNEPMRFFYQIIDYIAIRNRLFDVNRKSSHFRDRKSSPASNEDTNVSSPTLNLNDNGSEASSGTDSPMPDDNSTKQMNETIKNIDKLGHQNKDEQDKSNTNKGSSLSSDKSNTNKSTSSSSKKSDEEAEKSQFLNSFELTPKSNCVPVKTSPIKSNESEEPTSSNESVMKTQINLVTADEKILESFKRKHQVVPNTPELKKLKIELEKAKIPNSLIMSSSVGLSTLSNQSDKAIESPLKTKDNDGLSKNLQITPGINTLSGTMTTSPKDNKHHGNMSKQQLTENSGIKRSAVGPLNISSPKRKPNEIGSASSLPPQSGQKTIKLQIPKPEAHTSMPKTIDTPRPPVKKMPDLKPSTSLSQVSQQKTQPINKVRMDFLANNSDPTIDRSKILSQVTTSLSPQNFGQASGDPLKSLFDSCKINIPSSLSITLTDQKLDCRNPNDSNVDPKKGMVNKNLSGTSNNVAHKVPAPPVHNYIEILKLPDIDTKKQSKTEGNSDSKPNSNNKTESPSTPTKNSKSTETSGKGPVPNLKPISDTKLGKQSGNYASPITFQQTFEQQVQFMQCDKKSKVPKNKAQVPKLVPATPKSLSAASKPNSTIVKPITSTATVMENKTGTALDLSTPHNIQNQYVQQQQTFDKVFETMQSIANLAKKQNLPTKGLPMSIPQTNVFSTSRPINTGVSPLRIPSASNINQMKLDKVGPSGSQINRQELSHKSNQLKPTTSASATVISASLGYQMSQHASISTAQPSPRSQTRSPSSSPKLVIAEEKQSANSSLEQNMNQSNQISSTQLPTVSLKPDPPKATPGPSKPGLKPVKTLPPTGKVTGMRQPVTPTMKTTPPMANPADYLIRPQLMAQQHHALLRQQMEMAWFKAQKPYELLKSISSMTHQTQNDFNNKDKQ